MRSQDATGVALEVEAPVEVDVEVLGAVEVGVLEVAGVEVVVGVDGVVVEPAAGVVFDEGR